MKKVWILNHYAGQAFSDRGGRHYNFAKFLRQKGYEPVVFCSNAKHNAEGLFYEDESLWHEHMAGEIGVPFVFVRSRAYQGNGKQRVLNMLDFYGNVKKTAVEYAQKYGKPDVILASSVHPLTLVAGIRLAKRFGVRCVCEVRDLWPETLVADGIAGAGNPAVLVLRAMEKWIYARADALVFTMEGGRDYIVDRKWDTAHGGPVDLSKVFYINNGVDLEQFDYNREHCVLEDEDLADPSHFKVVYAGSIRKGNNLGILIDAAKELADPRIRFLVWGGGDELPTLRRRVQEENVGGVVFKGFVEKKYIPYVTSRANLNFAHSTPSAIYRYGISYNKLFEYLAAGVPVLTCCPTPYNPAIQGNAGIDAGEPTAAGLAAAVRSIADMDSGSYAAYCANARTAAAEYDFSSLTDKLIAVLEGT